MAHKSEETTCAVWEETHLIVYCCPYDRLGACYIGDLVCVNAKALPWPITLGAFYGVGSRLHFEVTGTTKCVFTFKNQSRKYSCICLLSIEGSMCSSDDHEHHNFWVILAIFSVDQCILWSRYLASWCSGPPLGHIKPSEKSEQILSRMILNIVVDSYF